MAAKKHILLFGALMFTLSSLPGLNQAVQTESAEFSSVSSQISDCDISGQLKAKGEAHCRVSQNSKTHGTVTVTKKLDENSQKEMILLSSEVSIEGVSGCTDCVTTLSKQRKHFGSLVDVASATNQLFLATSKEAAAKKAKRAAHLVRVENCEEREMAEGDEEAEKITSAREREECKLDRLAALKDTDAEKADQYYDKHFRGQLKELLEGCRTDLPQPCDPAARRKAEALLQKLSTKLDFACANTPSVNPNQARASALQFSTLQPGMDKDSVSDDGPAKSSIKDSACDFHQFSNYTKAIDMIKTDTTTHPMDKQNLLRNLKANWGGHFQSRGLQLAEDVNANLFGIGDQMSIDLQAQNQRMMMGFDAIEKFHKDTMDATRNMNGAANSQQQQRFGRDARGGFGPRTAPTGTASTGLSPQAAMNAPSSRPNVVSPTAPANTARMAPQTSNVRGGMPRVDTPAGNGAPIR